MKRKGKRRRTRIVPRLVLAFGAAVGVPACNQESPNGDMRLEDLPQYPRDVSAHAFDLAAPDLAMPDLAVEDLRSYPTDVSAHAFDIAAPSDLSVDDEKSGG
jgi:hypothetical protein